MENLYIACCTYPDEKTAKENARRLVEAHLAACVWILPSLSSIFWWEGTLQEESEFVLFIKTTRNRIPDVQKLLLLHHPYSVPEFLAFPAEIVSESYLKWAVEQVKS
ncbi:MAG: divalent-cation tolerance protein CutA [bacterium JZ-2024 1]